MCVRHPGFVLLLCLPAVLLVQREKLPCRPPDLVGGFVLPRNTEYAHNQTISYSCDNGRKPAVEGWWARITCVDGKWSPTPQCIDENNCFPPDVVPNTKYSQSPTGWFPNKRKIQITCDKGYETKNNELTAQCVNGAWTSLPVCEISVDSCSEPPQLPHAVIVNQKHQEVFAADSVVMYQCEDRFTTEQGHRNKSVICLYGSWTDGPTCKQTDSGSGSGPFTPVSKCGQFPDVPNSKVTQINSVSLKFRCVAPYSLTGPEVVVCHDGGVWSKLPTCTAAGHCVLDPAQYEHGKWIYGYKGENVPEGQTVYPHCSVDERYTRAVKCSNGRLTIARQCCFHTESEKGRCW